MTPRRRQIRVPEHACKFMGPRTGPGPMSTKQAQGPFSLIVSEHVCTADALQASAL